MGCRDIQRRECERGLRSVEIRRVCESESMREEKG
jgi:hypothetical protein